MSLLSFFWFINLLKKQNIPRKVILYFPAWEFSPDDDTSIPLSLNASEYRFFRYIFQHIIMIKTKTLYTTQHTVIMNLKNTSTDTSYLPVAWEYREVIEEEIEKKTVGKIFYFCASEGICEAQGRIVDLKEEKNSGLFIFLDTEAKIRIDRIITLFGKPGAAYDEYDAYANACMDCMGGYEKDEL